MDTIAVSGGNGKIGKALIQNLSEHGYRTVNLSRGKPRERISDKYITTDLLDPGNVYGSLAKSDADAIIHMGTIREPTKHPGYVTYRSNVMSSYLVLEAAMELGLESVCLPSSINVMGATFQVKPMEVYYIPVDEEHSLTPRDPYALGKQVIEITAQGFGRLGSHPKTISTLRYPWVAYEEELKKNLAGENRDIDSLQNESTYLTKVDVASIVPGRDDLFSYIHIDDAVEIARLAIEADFVGHETFWAVAGDTTVDVPSSTLTEKFYPKAEMRSELSEFQSLISTEKAKRILGWEPKYSWRNL